MSHTSRVILSHPADESIPMGGTLAVDYPAVTDTKDLHIG
jgi:LmbE family N-acetylglucosaminyl deacetylase